MNRFQQVLRVVFTFTQKPWFHTLAYYPQETPESFSWIVAIVSGKKEDDAKREFAQTQFMILLESTVEDLTKGYLAANGNKKALTFDRLQKEISKELK